MYIDANLRAARLPARTPASRFGTRPLASSLVAHAAIAVALVLLVHRTMLPMPVETPPIPMVFLPPEPAPVAPPQTQPEPVQPTPPEPVLRQPEPPPPEPPPPPPEVAPAPPPPVVREPPPPPPPRREPQVRRVPTRPRPVQREPEPTPATRAPLAPPITAPARPAAPAAPPVAAETGPVVPPQPLSLAARAGLPYPPWAERDREQGRVVLRVDVTTEGTVASVSIVRSTAFPRLDQYAVDAVRTWRFTPATRGGRPVAGTAEVPFNFELRD